MPTTFRELVEVLITIISDGLIILLVAATFAVLVWKIIQTYILNVADAQQRETGKQTIVAALIFLVLFISLWGVIAILQSSIFG